MHGSRIFDPVKKGFDSSVQLCDVLWYDSDNKVSRIHPVINVSKTPVVICISCSCRGNFTSTRRAAYGVFTAEGSRYNTANYLPYLTSQTNQAAEIYAVTHVVEKVLQAMGESVCREGVVIVSNSNYTVQAITEHVYYWEKNGYLNTKGQPVANGEALRELHHLIRRWEKNSRARIRFWKVPRDQNREAHRLAKRCQDLGW